MWARVKNGKYKGDLAQVVPVNNERKRTTVKLIPRIDLQAMAAKFVIILIIDGGGVSINRTVTPAPKLISLIELEEFRPLIQYRRDHETGIGFQILDGMLFNDGYLYKKLYGEKKRKKTITNNKGGEKGEGSSGLGMENSFKLRNLVCFGRNILGLLLAWKKMIVTRF